MSDPDRFTETTTTSYSQRLANSFIRLLIGVLFFLAAFPLLWWNEGRSVDRIKMLDEGRNLVVAVSSVRNEPANDGKLIYTTGRASVDEGVTDSLFGVHEAAIKLKRTAEMYQWREQASSVSHKNLGGSETTQTTYSYEKVWAPKLINSSGFKHKAGHENPATMPYTTQVFVAPNVMLGGFKLSGSLVSHMNVFADYPVSDQTYANMTSSMRDSFRVNGAEYLSGDPANTVIGAIRIRYGIIMPTDISVVGKQAGEAIEPYMTRHGDLDLLEMGIVGADSMFTKAGDDNMLLTWGLRVGGCLAMFIGLTMVLGPLQTLADVVPFIGALVGAGAGVLAGAIALGLSFLTVAFAWVFYRPLIGIVLLLVAAGFVFGGARLVKRARKA